MQLNVHSVILFSASAESPAREALFALFDLLSLFVGTSGITSVFFFYTWKS